MRRRALRTPGGERLNGKRRSRTHNVDDGEIILVARERERVNALMGNLGGACECLVCEMVLLITAQNIVAVLGFTLVVPPNTLQLLES